MRTLALIPARAGSKSIPGKNRRLFEGEPLWKLALEIGARTCDDWIISTDDAEILRHSCAFPRPVHLAQDDTPMLAVVSHAVAMWGADVDVVVLLEPTQPLRKPAHVEAALKLLEETGADSVVSVVQIPPHYSPEYVCRLDDSGLRPYLYDSFGEGPKRRQNCEPAYSRDGTVYAIKRETIENGSLYGSHCVPLIIPSNESCNLDTEEDWIRAESMVKR